jgi:hypothetical protein
LTSEKVENEGKVKRRKKGKIDIASHFNKTIIKVISVKRIILYHEIFPSAFNSN